MIYVSLGGHSIRLFIQQGGRIMKEIKITVNNKTYELQVKPWATLLDMIRDDLGLIGTKEGCGEGECGACTVIVDGQTVNPASFWQRRRMVKRLRPSRVSPMATTPPDTGSLSRSWGHAVRFLHPGMILSAKVLLDGNMNPSDEDMRKGLEGNFCRCTGYTKIFESVNSRLEKMRGREMSIFASSVNGCPGLTVGKR